MIENFRVGRICWFVKYTESTFLNVLGLVEYDVKPRNNNRELPSPLIPQENPQGVAGMQKTKIPLWGGHHLQQKWRFSEWLLT